MSWNLSHIAVSFVTSLLRKPYAGCHSQWIYSLPMKLPFLSSFKWVFSLALDAPLAPKNIYILNSLSTSAFLSQNNNTNFWPRNHNVNPTFPRLVRTSMPMPWSISSSSILFSLNHLTDTRFHFSCAVPQSKTSLQNISTTTPKVRIY